MKEIYKQLQYLLFLVQSIKICKKKYNKLKEKHAISLLSAIMYVNNNCMYVLHILSFNRHSAFSKGLTFCMK